MYILSILFIYMYILLYGIYIYPYIYIYIYIYTYIYIVYINICVSTLYNGSIQKKQSAQYEEQSILWCW